MGRVKKHRQIIGAQTYNLEYIYNLAGQLTKEIYPSGREVSVGYDTKGRMSGISDASRTYLSNLQYLGKGNSLSSMTFGNGTTQAFTLNDRLQMTNQTLTKGAETIQKYDYNYGELDSGGVLKNNGKLEQIESHIGTQKQWKKKFVYDAVGRLSKEEEYRGDNSALVYRNQYDYDRFGNLYRKQTANPNSLSSAWIEDSHISKSTNRFTTGTTYDDAGNVTTDTKFRNSNFWYDANGRMFKTSNVDNTNQANSVYDAAGQRVATKHYDLWTFYIYDAFGKKVAEYGGLQGTDEGGVKYILSDWQGSTRVITSNTGVVQARMDYTAFGEEINAGTGQRTTQQGFGANQTLRNKYALTERDQATGLDHTWFRKNENKAGRWTSPDPYNGSMSLGNPQSFNRYSYVENQPTNFVDPTGLLKEGELCQINGQVDSNGNPVYQGTVVNGRCQSHAGSPVVISGGWLFPISWGGGGISTIITPRDTIGIGGGGGGTPTSSQYSLSFSEELSCLAKCMNDNRVDKFAKALGDSTGIPYAGEFFQGLTWVGTGAAIGNQILNATSLGKYPRSPVGGAKTKGDPASWQHRVFGNEGLGGGLRRAGFPNAGRAVGKYTAFCFYSRVEATNKKIYHCLIQIKIIPACH